MRPVTLTSIVRYTNAPDRPAHWRPERITTDTARRLIRRAPRQHGTVTVYETTDRGGSAITVAHVQFGSGFWDSVLSATDIYEIPTTALTTF